MTTTNLYSGYDVEGKSSSRVLNPPGGKSNNIFGTAEETPQIRQQPQQKQVLNDQNQNSGNTGSPANPPPQAQQARAPDSKKKVSYNPITGEEYPEDYGKKKPSEGDEDEEEESTDEKKEETPTTNPTPADPNEPHLGAKKKTAVKVRQPPGGASSGLW